MIKIVTTKTRRPFHAPVHRKMAIGKPPAPRTKEEHNRPRLQVLNGEVLLESAARKRYSFKTAINLI